MLFKGDQSLGGREQRDRGKALWKSSISPHLAQISISKQRKSSLCASVGGVDEVLCSTSSTNMHECNSVKVQSSLTNSVTFIIEMYIHLEFFYILVFPVDLQTTVLHVVGFI